MPTFMYVLYEVSPNGGATVEDPIHGVYASAELALAAMQELTGVAPTMGLWEGTPNTVMLVEKRELTAAAWQDAAEHSVVAHHL